MYSSEPLRRYSVRSHFNLMHAHPGPRGTWYGRRRSLTPEQSLAQELNNAVESLRELQKAPSKSEIEWTENYLTESDITAEGGIKGSDSKSKLSVSFAAVIL